MRDAAKARAYQRQYREKMPAEQRERYEQRRRGHNSSRNLARRVRRAAMTPDQRERENRLRRERKTPEQCQQQSLYWRQRYLQRTPIDTLKMLVRAARKRAVKANIPFSLTIEDILPPPARCPVFGVELDYGWKNGRQKPNSPSLDRIIPELGYVASNVAVISYRANAIKSNATPDELVVVARWAAAACALVKQAPKVA